MNEFFGVFSWPKMVEVLPVYLSAAATASAVGVALLQLNAARNEAAERGAISNLLETTTSPEWQSVRLEFIKFKSKLLAGEVSIEAFSNLFLGLNLDTDHAEDFFGAFRMIMNSYEVMAIGVLEGALSEKVYKLYTRGMFVGDWIAVYPLVNALRDATSNEAVYQKCEELFHRWAHGEEVLRAQTSISELAVRSASDSADGNE